MPFCPKCKAEYRDGFTICADCKVALVDSLEKKRPVEETEENPNEPLFMSFDEYAKLTDEDDFGSTETTINSEGNDDEAIEQEAFVSRVSKEPSPEEIEKIKAELIRRQMEEKQEAEYVSKKDKAGEYLSTGIMLIVMGALGCIFIGLLLAGVLPLKPHGLVSYIIDVIMFLFFGMFIGIFETMWVCVDGNPSMRHLGYLSAVGYGITLFYFVLNFKITYPLFNFYISIKITFHRLHFYFWYKI